MGFQIVQENDIIVLAPRADPHLRSSKRHATHVAESDKRSPPGTWIPLLTQSHSAISSRGLRPIRTFLSSPSTHVLAPSHCAASGSAVVHSPSSSPNRHQIQSHRAMRCVFLLLSTFLGGASNGSRPSIRAYSSTPSAHASVLLPS